MTKLEKHLAEFEEAICDYIDEIRAYEPLMSKEWGEKKIAEIMAYREAYIYQETQKATAHTR